MRLQPRRLWGLAALLWLGGCALLSKSEPLEWRYFEVSDAPSHEGASKASGGEQGQRLRLGLVKASHHLDTRMVSRTGAHELTYYEDLRWTEEPDEFVRRALTRNLYERAGLSRVVSGIAPTLEVELTAFEEIKDGGKRRAHVVLLTVLHDDRLQLSQHTVEVESDVKAGEGDEAQALVAALGRALGKAAAQVTEQTLQTLAERPKPAEPLAPAAAQHQPAQP